MKPLTQIFIVVLVAASSLYSADSLEFKAHIPWGWIHDFEFYHDGVFIAPYNGGISYFTVDDSFHLNYRYTIDPGGDHVLSQFCISDSILYALDGSSVHTPGTPVFFVYAITESTYSYLAGLEPSGTIWATFDPITYHQGNIFYQEYPGDYFRIDVTDPSNPSVTGRLKNTSDVCLAILPYQDTLLITARQQGYGYIGNFRVIKINEPDTLISLGIYGNRPSYTADLINIGPTLFSAHGDGFIVYDITDLQNPQEIYFYPTTWGRCLAAVNNYLFMGGNDGWYVFRYVNPDSIYLDEFKPNDRRVLRMRLRLDRKELWCFVDGGALGGLVVIDLEPYLGIKEAAPWAIQYPILGNYPNPFKSRTIIKYSVANPGPVELRIYNIAGQVVRTLVDEQKKVGIHTVSWDGKDLMGKHLANGIYFCQLKSGSNLKTRKMVILR